MGIEVFRSKLLYPDNKERSILCTNDPEIGVSCVDINFHKGNLAICVSNKSYEYKSILLSLKSGGHGITIHEDNVAPKTLPNESCPFYEDVSAFEQKETQKEESK